MKRMLLFLAVLASSVGVALAAQAQAPQPPPAYMYQSFSPTGRAPDISATNGSSTRVTLGLSAPVGYVCNTGAVTAYVRFGNSAVVASATADTGVLAGSCMTFNASFATHAAARTASSTATVEVTLGTGSPSSRGGGGGGSSGITSLTGDVTATGPGAAAATLVTNQPGAHTWAAAQTFQAAVTLSGTTLIFSGNISAVAWTTTGIRHRSVAATITDTTSSGTVAAAYTNAFGGNTIAASSATTYTHYTTAYFTEPAAGTNVTFTNKWGAGADSLRVGTSNQFTVTSAGAVTIGNITGSTQCLHVSTAGLVSGTGSDCGAGGGGLTVGTTTITSGTDTRVPFNDAGVYQESAGLVFLKGNGGTTSQLTIGANARLLGEAANTLALRNGANGQTYNVYGTFTDASNYARVQLSYNLGQQRAYLDSQVAGTSTYGELYLRAVTGTLYIDGNSFVQFAVTAVNKIFMDSTGMLGWNTDNTGDIGAAGATRPRSGYFGTNITAGAAIIAGTTVKTGGFTIAGLPAAGTAGRRAHVTDQLTTCAAVGVALTAGGSAVCPVFDNGSAWVGG